MIRGARPDSPYLALLPLERIVLIGGLLLIVVLSGIISFGSETGSHPLLYGSFLAYVGVLALPLFRAFLRAPGLFHPLFFYATWTGLRSLLTGDAVLGATGLEFHLALPGMGRTELELIAAKSFLLEALALVALYVGYFLSREIQVPRLRQPAPPKRLVGAVVLWMVLPTVAVAILSMEAGSLGELLLQRGIGSDQRIAAEIGRHWNYLAGVGTIVPVVWLAFDRGAAKYPLFWVVALLSAFLVFAATGSRSSAIWPFILVALTWALRHRRIPYRALWVAAGIAIVLIGLLGEFRAATRGVDTLEDVELQGDIWVSAKAGYDEMVARNTTNSGQMAVLGSVPDRVDHLLGESYLSIPFVVIPSRLWPGDTPDAAGKMNSTYIYGNPRSGVPTGPVGEAYWNFSYPGVVLVFVVFGGVLRFVASIYRSNSEHPMIIPIYLYTIVTLAPGSNEIYNSIHAFVPVVGFYLLIRTVDRVRLGKISVPRAAGLVGRQ
ncbi:oligosaccharide repeat unit polymerase [Aquisalimonas sp. 2447]|uniref:oligosaccharide repeat unit polymerase n=1 Tax=Aquisalimonas sp. 2447 TaxID=2740807 RepID=UPI0014324994|nr:oligosaccharide repeat unit polymerase [Aquisalimonas sp. 2447]QIT55913.1 oligosaccharide repeat unit polymerase [Aquisalimonas sp. 2447]